VLHGVVSSKQKGSLEVDHGDIGVGDDGTDFVGDGDGCDAADEICAPDCSRYSRDVMIGSIIIGVEADLLNWLTEGDGCEDAGDWPSDWPPE